MIEKFECNIENDTIQYLKDIRCMQHTLIRINESRIHPVLIQCEDLKIILPMFRKWGYQLVNIKDAQKGDFIVYGSWDSARKVFTPDHFGVFISQDTIESKWGGQNIYEHGVSINCYDDEYYLIYRPNIPAENSTVVDFSSESQVENESKADLLEKIVESSSAVNSTDDFEQGGINDIEEMLHKMEDINIYKKLSDEATVVISKTVDLIQKKKNLEKLKEIGIEKIKNVYSQQNDRLMMSALGFTKKTDRSKWFNKLQSIHHSLTVLGETRMSEIPADCDDLSIALSKLKEWNYPLLDPNKIHDGCLVTYQNWSSSPPKFTPVHFGIFENGKVQSKWPGNYVYEHPINDIPLFFNCYIVHEPNPPAQGESL